MDTVAYQGLVRDLAVLAAGLVIGCLAYRWTRSRLRRAERVLGWASGALLLLATAYLAFVVRGADRADLLGLVERPDPLAVVAMATLMGFLATGRTRAHLALTAAIRRRRLTR